MDTNHHPTARLFVLDISAGRILSMKTDGSDGRVIVTGCRMPDGIVVDTEAGHIYWTNMGVPSRNDGSIERADVDGRNRQTIVPEGCTFTPKPACPSARTDIELLYDGLPEPIDLELDLTNRQLYWTDRGDPPRGNTVSRAPMDGTSGRRPAPEILVTHLMEAIGIALDVRGNRMFLTDLAGSIYSANLDGSGKRPLLVAQGNLTGIAYSALPRRE